VDKNGVNPAGDKVGLHTNDGDVHTVSLFTNGRWTFFTMPTPEDALKLYEALMCVKETEAD
jgi:hypothetical protein